jgi:hypothetical protein
MTGSPIPITALFTAPTARSQARFLSISMSAPAINPNMANPGRKRADFSNFRKPTRR